MAKIEAMPDQPVYDVVVAGAGPAGSTFANSFLMEWENGGVCLVDRATFPRDKSCGDGIGPGAVKILRDLGLTGFLDGFPSIEYLKVRSPSGYELAGRLPKVGGELPIGYVIPRQQFDAALAMSALQRGADDYTGWSYRGARFDAHHQRWEVSLQRRDADSTDQEKVLFARVLVGADGARSRVRRTLGVPFNQLEHTGIGVRIYGDASQAGQRFLELDFVRELLPTYGWLFPISAQRYNVGIGIDASKYKALQMPLPKLLAAFQASLSPRFDFRYDSSTSLSYILPYGSQLPALSHPHAALIGDAASMINALTGEGIFYGMYAGQLLGSLVAECLRQGAAPQPSLDEYERLFKKKFLRHFKTNWAMKKWVAKGFLSDMLVKACIRDQSILSNTIDLMMGDARRLKPLNAMKILVKGVL